MRYVIDSWIEYVVVQKWVAKKESKVCGHYIAYKFIEGTLYHFNDGVVNSTTMLTEYEMNLMFYRRADIRAYAWDIDFGFITYMLPDCYGCKPSSLRTSLPISIDLKQAMVENQPVFPEPVPMNTSSDVTEVDKETDVVHANTENRTDTSDLPQSETERHAKASEVANVDTNKTDMQNIPETDKEIDIAKDSGPLNDNLQRDITDQSKKENVGNEALEELETNPNVNIWVSQLLTNLMKLWSIPRQMGPNLHQVGVHPTVMMTEMKPSLQRMFQGLIINLISV